MKVHQLTLLAWVFRDGRRVQVQGLKVDDGGVVITAVDGHTSMRWRARMTDHVPTERDADANTP